MNSPNRRSRTTLSSNDYAPSPDQPIGRVSAVQQNSARGCVVLFGLPFAIAGVWILYSLLFLPLQQVWAARNWTPITCRILSGQVVSHSGSDGSTYSAAITYSYVIGGTSYQGDRISFGGPVSGPYNGAAGWVAAYPAGSGQTCYVNPANPYDVVLERGLSGSIAFGLIGLPFFLIGGFMVFGGAFGSRRKSTPAAKWQPQKGTPRPSENGQIVLERSAATPYGRILGAWIAALFWNGITWTMAWTFLIKDGFNFMSLFSLLIIVPFAIIGLVVIGAAIRQIGTLFNPRPRLVIAKEMLHPGDSVTLTWQLSGGFTHPKSVQIVLEGREEATFTRGTDSVTTKTPFFWRELAATTNELGQGETRLEIPAGTMHSFEAPHNKIVWALTFHAPIPRWPDVKEEWTLVISP